MNRVTNLKCVGDTCCESYYGTILNLILMFSAAIDALEIIEEDDLFDQKVEAQSFIRLILYFEFVFDLHLIKNILRITNELSLALQNIYIYIYIYQDIVNAITFVEVSKQQLHDE